MSHNSKRADRYVNPYGYWEVTTEGDCEGRTTRHLGTFKGYLDEIAFSLADKQHYSLMFKYIDPQTDNLEPKRTQVNVTMDIDSQTWNMNGKERVAWWREFMKDRNVHVSEGSSFASVKLSLDKNTAEEMLKQQALAKLSADERELLGL